MKQHNIILLSIAALAAGTPAARAQELKQDVEVEHTADVRHYNASRVATYPQLVLPAVKVVPLQFSERTINVAIPRSIATLEPTAFADTLATSPYNGYAAIGYLPLYNLGASAGYRFLDNDRQRLDAWMQFDGSGYRDGKTLNTTTGEPYDAWIRRNTVTVGADYHLMLGRRSELDAGIDYTYGAFNATGGQALLPDGRVSNSLYSQHINSLNLSAQWMSGVGGLNYTAGADYSYFGYAHGVTNGIFGTSLLEGAAPSALRTPARENVIKLNAAAYLPWSQNSMAYLGINVDVVNNTHYTWADPIADGTFRYTLTTEDVGYTHAVLSLRPRYRLQTNNMQLTIGANVQLSFNADKVFHIAPDVSVSWTPTAVFTIWGKAGGGEHQNSLAEMYSINYMTLPMLAYRDSHVPLTVDGGIVAGPFKGGYVELFGGYAIANDWLMPVSVGSASYGPTMFGAVDIKGWHAGAAIGYAYRNWVDARVQFEAAPSSFDRGYYAWRDRAKYVATARLTSRPIKPLEVGLSYELRARRSIISRSVYTDPAGEYSIERTLSLGNISSLGINGIWHFNSQLSVFLNVENVLNRRYRTLGLVESQGIGGMAGVTYKF